MGERRIIRAADLATGHVLVTEAGDLVNVLSVETDWVEVHLHGQARDGHIVDAHVPPSTALVVEVPAQRRSRESYVDLIAHSGPSA